MQHIETLSIQEQLETHSTFHTCLCPGYSSPRISRRTIPQKVFVETPQLKLSIPQLTPMEKQMKNELLSLERVYGTKQTVSGQAIDKILETLGFPAFFKLPFLRRVLLGHTTTKSFSNFSIDNLQHIELPKETLLTYWRQHWAHVLDITTRVFELVKEPTRDYITPSDFEVFIKELLRTHPSLQALRDTPEYQDRYMETVIARIFYNLTRRWHNRITLNDLRRSNFVSVFLNLDKTNNLITTPDYFDYMSYYVILCKFYELDTDKDRYINKNDLRRYNNGTLSERMIERIFEVCRFHSARYTYYPDALSFQDFVWFILAEEDKTTQQSITLWFKCLDLHDRHYLTPEDLSYWYHEMANKMSVNMNHIIPFEYAFAQLVDMIHPQEPNKITLTDIKRSGVASPFFNMLFSWQRFLDDERHHPLKIFSSTHKHHHKYHSDWYRYAFKQWKIVLTIHRRHKHVSHHSQTEEDSDSVESQSEDVEFENRYLD